MAQDRMIQLAARVAHETNRAWCAANGDDSQKPWDVAPDWQKQSAIDGVRFHIDNPDAGDSASHDNWMRHKFNDGWIYGETKDETQKTHPCLVPFDQLPLEQQVKDALFRSVVHAIISRAEPASQVTSQMPRSFLVAAGDETLVEGFAAWLGSLRKDFPSEEHPTKVSISPEEPSGATPKFRVHFANGIDMDLEAGESIVFDTNDRTYRVEPF